MISQEQKRQLEQLKLTQGGQALQVYLKDKLETIGDISTVTSWEDTLGRKYAVDLIKDLFYMMEENETTTKQKNKYV